MSFRKVLKGMMCGMHVQKDSQLPWFPTFFLREFSWDMTLLASAWMNWNTGSLQCVCTV